MEKIHLLFEHYPALHTLVYLAGLVVLATVCDVVVKRVLFGVIHRFLKFTSFRHSEAFSRRGALTARLANIAPALVIGAGAAFVPGLPAAAVAAVKNVATAFTILMVAMAIGAALNAVNAVYSKRPDAMNRPIKGYIQMVQIGVYLVAAILMIATLVDKSPLILLSGLGAMAAVLMLIFQDTLLSLVASIQISSSGMVRVGDWIEMPQLNADGDVIDIALHTVRVQNWDKTITTVPTRRLITDSFKNWRGMQESGGRRIKRALQIDQASIHFLTADERARLEKFTILKDYLHTKEQDLASWNNKLAQAGDDPINTRRLTNIGTFRAYTRLYLMHLEGINHNMSLMVRQLPPGPGGLPIEIYCFTGTTAWADYENIQSDMFDHLYAVLPAFGLRAFQTPSGHDVQNALQVMAGGHDHA